ncbi:MAG: alpha-amylase [bacterium (Candidatus Stahlbacteria) CG23_combo_of_CG06-09_8_20_14_all_34_7]|nr:MAG: alpha-amylase [bacterium (Candidatus Stahlbacteria) CG23_combo_of_CG06-09_8_20_14_all_34_7]
MINILFYFQVHQPFRLKHLRTLDIGTNQDYFDDKKNRDIIKKIAEKCYIPTNTLLLKLIEKYHGKYKVSFSITGTAVEQFKLYAPEILESFKELSRTNCVEFIGETYYHSLAFLFDPDEFLEQIEMHKEMLLSEFGYSPVTFRNTELIYQNRIADYVWETEGFKIIIAEGADRILDWRSSAYAYKDYRKNLTLLLKNYKLSDDIAFRFSNKGWKEYPLTVEKYVKWIEEISDTEKMGRELFINLFMDYETFGEHQWEDTGIFKFMEKLPDVALKTKKIKFKTPQDVLSLVNYQQESLSYDKFVSWADMERDLSAWYENDMQKNALESLSYILRKIKDEGKKDLLPIARKLSTSDHFYYMCSKYFQDGDVHKYFSPYNSPEQAYIYYMNAIADLEERF